MGGGPADSAASYGSISVRRTDGERTLVLTGEIDLPVIESFEAAQRSEPVVVEVVDAGAVTYIGAAGIAFLLRYAQPHGGLTMRYTSPQMDRILELIDVTDVFRRPPTL